MVYLRVFIRGLAMVALVACNTRQIASGHIVGAAGVGFLISWLWWSNSSKNRPDARGVGVAYAAGAACGTVAGYLAAGQLAMFAEWVTR